MSIADDPDARAGALAQIIGARAASSTRPFIVAIDGRSGVGKSTLAKRLAARLSGALIEGDDFFAGGVGVRADPPEILARDCIDWRRLAGVLRDVIANRPARYRPFDWQAFDGSLSARATIIRLRPIVIVEGVYAARPELGDLVDHRVLLHLDEDERMRRLLDREGEISPWERQWHRAEDWYFANVAMPGHFDTVMGKLV